MTCNGDLRGPLGGAVQHGLFNGLHLLGVVEFGDAEDSADGLEDLGLVPLADLHAVLHGRDDVLVSVLGARLTALLCRSYAEAQREKNRETNHHYVLHLHYQVDQCLKTCVFPWFYEMGSFFLVSLPCSNLNLRLSGFRSTLKGSFLVL